MAKRQTAHEIAADYSLTPGELAPVLNAMVEIKQPTMVWGPPGVGKSSVAQQLSAKRKMELFDVRGTLCDPVDIGGLPTLKDVETPLGPKRISQWAEPDILPPSWGTGDYLLLLDELPSSTPAVQVAMYSLVQERRIHRYRLPDGAAIVACGNRESDRGVVHRMPTPLASRFIHIDLEVSVKDWQKWAVKADLSPEVTFFIEIRPELLHRFDPKQEEKAFPCPRTWEFVSKLMGSKAAEGLSPVEERAVIRGAVGEGAAIEFLAFIKVWRDMPHPQTIISNPKGAKVPEGSSALLATCGSLYRIADDTNFDAILAYTSRIRPEVAEFTVNSCLQRAPDLQYSKAYRNWLTENGGS